VDANETGYGVLGIFVVIGIALWICIAGEGWGCTSVYIKFFCICSPCGAIIGGVPDFFVVAFTAMGHKYLVVKDGQAWTIHTTRSNIYVVAPSEAVTSDVIQILVFLATMSQEQLILVANKGGGIYRGAPRISETVAPSCTVEDEVMKLIVGRVM
jgi:hypothetical protein